VGKHLHAVALILGTAFRADPRRAVIVVVRSLVSSFLFATMPFWLKVLANGAVAHSTRQALLAAGAAAASVTVTVFLGWIGTNATQLLQERTNLSIDEQLARLSLEVPGLEHFERPDYANQIALLREQRGALAGALDAITTTLQAVVLWTTTLALLVSIHPLLLLMPAFGLATLWSEERAQRIQQRTSEVTAERGRTLRYLFDLATDAQAGKELRVFGLSGEIVGRYEQLWREIDRERRRAGLQAVLLTAPGWLLFTIGYAGAIVVAVWLAVYGQTSVGAVLMTLTLAAEVHRYVGTATYLFSWLLGALAAVGRLLWLMDYAASARKVSGDPQPVPGRLDRGIRLEHVSFCYPGAGTEVLGDVNLDLPAGSTVALVGENGAGKTTLVKLLCGLYQPTSGRITVDDVELHRFDVATWRAQTAAAFQDFARFELLARETVGVGDLARIEDPAAVGIALRRAGAEELPAALANGLETQLGKDWEGGVELSGGQWQKLALGRALLREQPLLLILDEPTASLDAQTEHALFERYAEATHRSAAASGAITILVSHRFSTMRMADLIVVLDHGRVTEVGSHRELLARRGLYAELYELQAGQYR